MNPTVFWLGFCERIQSFFPDIFQESNSTSIEISWEKYVLAVRVGSISNDTFYCSFLLCLFNSVCICPEIVQSLFEFVWILQRNCRITCKIHSTFWITQNGVVLKKLSLYEVHCAINFAACKILANRFCDSQEFLSIQWTSGIVVADVYSCF